MNDTIRYTTVCRAHGQARARGREFAVDGWHAMRDHSWGIRSSMGVPTRISGIDRTPEEHDPRALRLWVPFQCGDHSGFINTHEDANGQTLDFEGRLDFDDGHSIAVSSMQHQLHYCPGSKRPIGGSFTLVDANGITRLYELQASGSPADVQAGGYYRGWADGLGPGIYRGKDTVEHDDYDTTPGAEQTGPPHVPVGYRLGPTEFPMHMTGPDGGTGMAHVEHSIRGSYQPYGFSGCGGSSGGP